jgi:hypothetical protein
MRISKSAQGMTTVAKKPAIKGTTAPKKPRQTSTTDRRDRFIKREYVNDQLATIRERYYGEKKKSAQPVQSKKTTREEKLAVTGVEETKKRRMTTSGLNASEARKALANELKNRIK